MEAHEQAPGGVSPRMHLPPRPPSSTSPTTWEEDGSSAHRFLASFLLVSKVVVKINYSH